MRGLRVSWIYLSIFAILILSGIFVKRVLGHPEFMTFFHLPAAVFLILAGYGLTKKNRERYRAMFQTTSSRPEEGLKHES